MRLRCHNTRSGVLTSSGLQLLGLLPDDGDALLSPHVPSVRQQAALRATLLGPNAPRPRASTNEPALMLEVLFLVFYLECRGDLNWTAQSGRVFGRDRDQMIGLFEWWAVVS